VSIVFQIKQQDQAINKESLGYG